MNTGKYWNGYIVRHNGGGAATLEATVCEVRPMGPISFWSGTTAIGRLTVAAREGKVCWVGIHDSAEFLESELRADFRGERVGAEQPELAAAAQNIAEEIANPGREFILPVAFNATPFQLAVWRELCAIPRGATRSYGEMARRLGRAQAARAVGRANGSNPLAVIIPCHRAISADGSLTGYRWGVEYKQRLLEHEGAAAVATSAVAGELSTARTALP